MGEQAREQPSIGQGNGGYGKHERRKAEITLNRDAVVEPENQAEQQRKSEDPGKSKIRIGVRPDVRVGVSIPPRKIDLADQDWGFY